MIDNSSHVGVQHFLRRWNAPEFDHEGSRGLVIGFGEGHEADYLKLHTKAKIVGIDIHSRIPAGHKAFFTPVLASAINLPFADASFNFVFFHHVIEHVPDPVASLVEITRLLVPGGILYIGTPNRHRIIGYTGAYNIPLKRKLRNNLMDYKYRLMGKFRNEMGAHAGFSKKELNQMLSPNFIDIEWLTEDYLMYKYRQRIPNVILNLLLKPSILEVAAPSIYVICRKPAIAETR